jgi:mannose-6-phosphate isomerase-like protein (cupin superfamily)
MDDSAALEGIDLTSTYVHLRDDHSVACVPVGPRFWAEIDRRTELHPGRLVMQFRFTEDWPTWEIHPAGDEVVILLDGSVDMVLRTAMGDRVVRLRGRGTCVVPRGTWHTARVLAPSEMLFLTAGAGTENRPASEVPPPGR